MILVTGSSGNVGAAVVDELRARGAPFRLGVRRPASVIRRGGEEIVSLDFLDASTFRGAARGCDAVFLLRPPVVSNTRRTLNPFIDVAREEGVRHIVFLSVAGAGTNPFVPHHAVENHLRDRAGGWTLLRPGFFAQNLGGAYRDDIARDDRLFVPAGGGRVAFVDVRDVAEVAASALVSPRAHDARSYTLTGPDPITFFEVAALLSRELARRIRYEPASVPAYAAHLRRRGMPLAQIAVQTVLHVGLRLGQAERVDDTLGRLLGRRPRSLAAYVRDHRALWTRS